MSGNGRRHNFYERQRAAGTHKAGYVGPGGILSHERPLAETMTAAIHDPSLMPVEIPNHISPERARALWVFSYLRVEAGRRA